MSTSEIKELSVSNLCVDCDLYTLKYLSPEDKYAIEDFFSKEIESDYSYVFNILTNDDIGFITPDQRVKILRTLISMYFRTPKFLNEFVESSVQLISSLATEKKGIFTLMGAKIELEDSDLKDIKKEIREYNRENFILTGLLLLDKYLKQRAYDGIVVIKLIGDQEFITSDNPVIITNIDGDLLDLFSYENSIYVPISPKYCVFIAPTSEGAIVNKIYRNHDNFIQHIILNDSTFQNAERWCMGTEIGLKEFIREQEEYSKPAHENHSIIVLARKKVEILLHATELVEAQNYEELRALISNVEKDEELRSDASFILMIEQLRAHGIL